MTKPRNPIARVVRQIRPQVVQDKRRKMEEAAPLEDEELDWTCPIRGQDPCTTDDDTWLRDEDA